MKYPERASILHQKSRLSRRFRTRSACVPSRARPMITSGPAESRGLQAFCGRGPLAVAGCLRRQRWRADCGGVDCAGECGASCIIPAEQKRIGTTLRVMCFMTDRFMTTRGYWWSPALVDSSSNIAGPVCPSASASTSTSTSFSRARSPLVSFVSDAPLKDRSSIFA